MEIQSNALQTTSNNVLAHRLFIGGLPKQTTLSMVRPMFEQYGAIQHINIVPDTMNPLLCRGYGFLDYVDPNVAQHAINVLNGQPYGGSILKVQFSSQGGRQSTQVPKTVPTIEGGAQPGKDFSSEAAIAAALAMTHATGAATSFVQPQSVPQVTPLATGPPLAAAPPKTFPSSRVIVLMNMVPLEELDQPSLYAELVQEISDECQKFGTLISTVVPKQGTGRGKVYLQYEQIEHANVAYRCLQGRKFGPAVVECAFYAEEIFLNGKYE